MYDDVKRRRRYKVLPAWREKGEPYDSDAMRYRLRHGGAEELGLSTFETVVVLYLIMQAGDTGVLKLSDYYMVGWFLRFPEEETYEAMRRLREIGVLVERGGV